jgi:hypothetical protein
MLLIPSVIDVTTNYLEHPELVTDRIEQLVVGGDSRRVIARTDCGFATVAGCTVVAEDVVWAKLKALSDGARLATERLFRWRSAAICIGSAIAYFKRLAMTRRISTPVIMLCHVASTGEADGSGP